MTPSRRDFFRISAGAGGSLVIGVCLPGCALLPGPSSIERHATRTGEFKPNAWVRITPDDRVIFTLDRVEMGQGTMTSHAAMLAEELEVDPRDIQIEMAEADRKYDNPDPQLRFQITGGSTSTRTSWEPLRRAGATAREMLRRAAADLWHVALAECVASGGAVVHPISGRRARYGELAAAAARQDVPKIRLKEPAEFRYIGTPMRRLDAPAKVDGSAIYGIDVAVPDMRVAVVIRPPVRGSRVRSLAATSARASPGVEHVFAIAEGIAVVARSYWEARRAAEAVEVEWTTSSVLADFDSASGRQRFAALADEPGKKMRARGNTTAALASAARTLEATYEVPYLAHAPMEPMNCTAHVTRDRCEIWAPTQSPGIARQVASELTGLDQSAVRVHTTFLGGGFGRRIPQDYVAEAVQIARRVEQPVKVIWSREDDMRNDFYRPMMLQRLTGGIDDAGAPVAWRHRVVGQSIVAHSAPDFLGALAPAATPRALRRVMRRTASQMFRKNVISDFTSTEGAADVPYAIPNLRVEYTAVETGVPIGWWRSVGHSHTAFAVECFLDELAHAAGRDPLEVRLAAMKQAPRERRVLELAANKAAWGSATPAGIGRGLAVHASFHSYCAQVMEVSFDGRRARVHRVVAAIDCGRVINPDIVRSQVESAVIFGLSAALDQQITFEAGRVREGNFHEFPLLRMHECPRIEVHIVDSDEPPTGVGEPGVPPVAPALCNALFAASGRRVRRLPVSVGLAEAS